MSYKCGIGPGFEMAGFKPRDPHIMCDKCGVTKNVFSKHGIGPYKWFLDDKPAPGWYLKRVEEPFKRIDYCPKCKP